MSLPTDIDRIQDLVKLLMSQLSALETEVMTLRSENALLKSQLAQSSTNSHRPPSSDGLTKKPAFARPKGGKTGGQKGHSGKNLKMVTTPDVIETHLPTLCKRCGQSLINKEMTRYESRQVFEIPPPKLIVTEHQAFACLCGCGQRNLGNFPTQVQAPVQYGVQARGLASLLNQQYLLPFGQVSALFEDLFNQPINESTIISANHRLYDALEPAEQAIKNAIIQSKVVHFDETGARVEGHLNWLHVASNDQYTYYFHHHKRGQLALMDTPSVLPYFKGYAVHDCWASYFKFDKCLHILCNAHLLRELQAAFERGFSWANDLKIQLNELYQNNKLYRQTKKLLKKQLKAIQIQLLSIQNRNPVEQKALALVKRIKKRLKSFLAFAKDPDLPFTNNLAERDIRMVKLKLKISGSFRTLQGIQHFARIRGYISTVRKQGINVFHNIVSALENKPFIVNCPK
jgi:transposase